LLPGETGQCQGRFGEHRSYQSVRFAARYVDENVLGLFCAADHHGCFPSRREAVDAQLIAHRWWDQLRVAVNITCAGEIRADIANAMP
jgi:hypothetical protein